MRASINIGNTPEQWNQYLELLVQENMKHVGKYPPIYELAKAGELVYRPEARGLEEWLTLPEIIERGYADCEDLAAARAAELRYSGIPQAAAQIVRTGFTRQGDKMFHGVTTDEQGTLEDPTKILKIQELVNHKGMKPSYWFKKVGGKHLGAIALPSTYTNRYGLPAGEGYTQFLGDGGDFTTALLNALVKSTAAKTTNMGTGSKAVDKKFPGLLSDKISPELLKALLAKGDLTTPSGNKKAAKAIAANKEKTILELLKTTTPQEQKDIKSALATGNKDQAIMKLLSSGAMVSNPYTAAAMVALNVLQDPNRRNELKRAFKKGAGAAKKLLSILF